MSVILGIIFLCVTGSRAWSLQTSADDNGLCNVKKTNVLGYCIKKTYCPVNVYNNQIQYCGVSGTEPLVCCPIPLEIPDRIDEIDGDTLLNTHCKMDDGKNVGLCRELMDCPSAIAKLVKERVPPVTCGFKGNSPVVCCNSRSNNSFPLSESSANSASKATQTEESDLEEAAEVSSTTRRAWSTTTFRSIARTTTASSSLIAGGSRRKVGQISESKCQEYADAVNSQTERSSRNRRRRQQRRLPCNNISQLEKSVGYSVQIGYDGMEDTDNQIQYSCGGILISEKFVLISAQCAYDKKNGYASVVRVPSTGEVIRVSTVLRHPEFTTNSKYNNIALIELEKNVQFTSVVRPACLRTKDNKSTETYYVLSLNTENNKNVKDKVVFIKNNQCNKTFGVHESWYPEGITENLMCARMDNQENCEMLQNTALEAVNTKFCMNELSGIYTFCTGCSEPTGSLVFIKISKYISWIESVVWPETAI